MAITIVNVRHPEDTPGTRVYIGRKHGGRLESPLANPIHFYRTCIVCRRTHQDTVEGRQDLVTCYWEWLRKAYKLHIKVKEELERLIEISKTGDLVLECWCSPKLCHGHVIKALIEGLMTLQDTPSSVEEQPTPAPVQEG